MKITKILDLFKKKKTKSLSPEIQKILKRMEKTDNLDSQAVPDIFASEVHSLRKLVSKSMT